MDKTRLITTSPVVAATPPTRPAPVDMKAVRREIRAIRRGIGGSLDVLLQQVRTCLAADDPVTALNLLEVLADENVAELSFAGWHEPEIWEEGEGWEEREDRDDEPTGYFDELGPLWAKALLTRELPKAERLDWVAKLEGWRENAAHREHRAAFDLAIAAARQGWDDPALLCILRGQPADLLAGMGGAGEISDQDELREDLTGIRLAILDSQGRFDEYLNLAAAANRVILHATMLLRLGRVQEAVDFGLAHLTTADEALALAGALQARGKPQDAVWIARHGMSVQGPKCALATWLRGWAILRKRQQRRWQPLRRCPRSPAICGSGTWMRQAGRIAARLCWITCVVCCLATIRGDRWISSCTKGLSMTQLPPWTTMRRTRWSSASPARLWRAVRTG